MTLINFTRNCWLEGITRYEFTYVLSRQLGVSEIRQAHKALRIFDELERIYRNELEKTRY